MLANALASIDSLETFPGRFPRDRRARFLPLISSILSLCRIILLFYRIDSSTQTVHILRFLYGHSDWQAILRADVLPT